MNDIRKLLLAALVLAVPWAARAQTLPLDQKARFDRSLEEKAETVLARLLGPGKAQVTADATLDFSTIERVRIERGEGRAPKEGMTFLWEQIDELSRSGRKLLPGFPAWALGSESYEKSVVYPKDYIKRLSVTLLLDEGLSDEKAAQLEGVVANVLDVQPDRGDTLKVVRMRFSTPWETMLQTPETAGALLRYGVLVGLAAFALLVIGVCFMRLASAMSQMAKLQLQSIPLEVPRPAELARIEALAGLVEVGGAPAAEREEARGATPGQAELELRGDQLEGLPLFLSPLTDDVATAVLFCLPPEQAAKALEGLPDSRRKELMLKVSETVQLEPAVLGEARERLRGFVDSCVAGQRRLKEAIALLPEETQARMLDQLRAAQPKLARELAEGLRRFDDLASLDSASLKKIAAAVPAPELALALRGAEDPVRDAVLASLDDPARRPVEASLRDSPPQPMSRVRQARRRVVDAWKRLAEQGAIEEAGAAEEPLV